MMYDDEVNNALEPKNVYSLYKEWINHVLVGSLDFHQKHIN